MDASFCFNMLKHDDFIVRNKFRALKKSEDLAKTKNSSLTKRFGSEDKKRSRILMQSIAMRKCSEDSQEHDEMEQFFIRHKNDRYHWNKQGFHMPLPSLHQQGNHFMLPRPRSAHTGEPV